MAENRIETIPASDERVNRKERKERKKGRALDKKNFPPSLVLKLWLGNGVLFEDLPLLSATAAHESKASETFALPSWNLVTRVFR